MAKGLIKPSKQIGNLISPLKKVTKEIGGLATGKTLTKKTGDLLVSGKTYAKAKLTTAVPTLKKVLSAQASNMYNKVNKLVPTKMKTAVSDFFKPLANNRGSIKIGALVPDLSGSKNAIGKVKDAIKGGSTSKVLNNKGVPYPDVEVKGYGKVELPSGPYEPNNSKLLRPQFTDSYKKQFKEWWTEQGKPWPEGEVNIHHIKPLSKGGDNSFENLVPLIQPVEHQPFTNWWRSFP